MSGLTQSFHSLNLPANLCIDFFFLGGGGGGGGGGNIRGGRGIFKEG